MALAHRTSSGHTASPFASASTASAATMIATSPPSPARPPPPVSPWDRYSSARACFSDLAAVFAVLACFSCVAFCLLYAARFLLRCIDRRRAARQEAAREPKPPSDADAVGSAGTSPVAAGVWAAEAECAICLAELDLEGGDGERVRVLPACGHGFHAACVEAWLATRASCPTCRGPSRSRPSSRTTGQP